MLQANYHMFIPSERRIPKVRIETRQVNALVGKRIVVAIDFWPRNSRYPWVRVVFCHLLIGLYQILAQAKNQPLLQIRLRPKCSRISVFGRFAKWRIQILQCSVFQLLSKNCSVDVADLFVYFVEISPSSHD